MTRNYLAGFSRGSRVVVALALALSALGGCGSKVQLPKTYPVRGRVVYKGGGPLTGGVVQFQAAADPKLLINGEIGKDGTFALTTRLDGHQVAGAVEGAHQVTVTPPMPADQSAEPIVLKKTFTVQAGDNFFDIEIEKPRR